jgi:phosphoglucosamine mutase
MCGCYLHEQGRLPGDTVVATVMSNLGLELGLRARGIAMKRTAVGDRYVLEELLAGGYALGGEQSGHVIFREHSTTGDGIVTAVQVLHVLDQSGQSLAELAGQMQRYPQRLINVPVADRNAYGSSEAAAQAVTKAEVSLGDRGRVLVRPSGTEPLVRVMVEATTAAECDAVAEGLAATIREVLGRA